MDEDVVYEMNTAPMRHDRWSILIPALVTVSCILENLSGMMLTYANFASQHSSQLEYDKRFKEVMK